MTAIAWPPTREAGATRLSLWLLRYAVRRWPALLAVFATLLLTTGLKVLRPWPLKVLVDHVLGTEPLPAVLGWAAAPLPDGATREGLLLGSIAATVVIFLLGWSVELTSVYAKIAFGQRLVYDLAADLFNHLQRLSLRVHGRRRIGDSIRRVTTDSSCVSTIVEEALLPLLTAVFSLVAMFAIMWEIDAVLTLLSLAVVPLMVLALRRYAGPILKGSYREQEAEGQVYDVIEQTLSAIPMVQAFGREEDADRRFRFSTQSALNATLSITRVKLEFFILLGIAGAFGTAAVLWVGARHVLEGQLTIGGVLVFLAYLASLYEPLHSIMHTSSTMQGAAGSAMRVLEVLETEQEVRERAGARVLGPVRGHLQLEGVSFGYEPGRPVLRDVSLEVLPGQRVAIVGPTGAGKSTLVSLVPRLFDPWSGRVLVDGQDVRDVQLKSLRAQVALVLQEPFLFPFSIAENIAYGRPDATRREIEAAAVGANAHEFIARLPRGYETLVGERGATLSGGERQRLAIARALLKDAPMLILDEPTSSLDAETEGRLLEALERLMRGRTTLLIAHRLSTVRGADWIAVLQGGRVVETGSHPELLETGGLYARFHALQFGRSSVANQASAVR